MKNHKKLATAISGANRLLAGSVVAAALVFGASGSYAQTTTGAIAGNVITGLRAGKR